MFNFILLTINLDNSKLLYSYCNLFNWSSFAPYEYDYNETAFVFYNVCASYSLNFLNVYL